jgi:RNase P/RNase MRP subunit POP5
VSKHTTPSALPTHDITLTLTQGEAWAVITELTTAADRLWEREQRETNTGIRDLLRARRHACDEVIESLMVASRCDAD